MGKDYNGESKRVKILVNGFALAALALAILACIGWVTNNLLLASFNSAYIPMALSTASLFLLFGIALLIYNNEASSKNILTIARIVNIAGIILSVLFLFLSLNNTRLDVEHLWLATSYDENRFVLGHMSPVTAFCLILIGTSVLLVQFSSIQKKLRVYGYILSALTVIIAFILILLYIFGVPLFYGGAFIPPALTTSFSILFFGLANSTIFGTNILFTQEQSDVFDKRTFFTIALLYLVLAVGLLTAGYSYFKSYEANHRREVERVLLSVTDLKVNEIKHWRGERLGDASLFFNNPNFSGLVKQLIQNDNDADAHQKIQIWLNRLVSAYSYDMVCLHSAPGKELLKYPDIPSNHSASFQQHLKETGESGKINFLDFHRNEKAEKTLLRITVPIFDFTDGKQLIGFLAIRIDPEEYLYPLIKKWPVPSQSTETLLLRREGNEIVYLNELRFNKGSILTVRRPITATQIPAVKAALGVTGIVEGLDYRGVEVIASVAAIPNSPWFIVARIDREEVYLPVRQIFLAIMTTVFILILSSGAGFGFFFRRQKIQYYKERWEGAEQIRKLNRLYSVLSNINQAIVRLHDKEDLFREACKIAVYEGNFVMAWVGFFNEEPPNITLRSFSGDEECGSSLKKELQKYNHDESYQLLLERPYIICNDVFDDCEKISWHASIIKTKCQSFMYLPLIVNEKKIGVFALYSEIPNFFDESERRLLSELALDISFGVEFIEKEEKRKTAEEQLSKLNEELEERILERTKSLEISNHELESFAYSVSHDLRAPLRAINGFSKFLEEDYASILDDEGKRHLKVIRDNSQKMDQLITDLLSLSKVARVNLNLASINITGMVKNIYDELIPDQQKNAFTFKINTLPDCYGDPTMIKQLWTNLISNAIKYTMPKERKEIEVKGNAVDGELVYSISDSGVGFDPTYKHKLFGTFQRLHGETEFEGTGVGLAIVKRIAERHLGRVWAKGELNAGATFYLAMPIREELDGNLRITRSTYDE